MKSEKGNALFLVLVAIALFAALSFAVTQSSRTIGDIDPEKLSLQITQVQQYAGAVRAVVRNLLMQGAAASEIRLHGGSTSSPCVNGINCVFSSDGGGLAAQDWPGDPSIAWGGNADSWDYRESADSYTITGVGTSASELAMMVGDGGHCLKPAYCDAFNAALGLQNSPSNADSAFGGEVDAYPGETMACYYPAPFLTNCGFIYVVLQPL